MFSIDISMFCITWGFQALSASSGFSLVVYCSSGCCLQAWVAVRLAVSGVQPHPGKRSPSSTATSQTSVNFHLLWNVVRRGHKAIFRSLLYFSVTAVCLPRQFELLAISSGQAEGGSLVANLSKHLAPAQATGRQSGWMIYCCRCS